MPYNNAMFLNPEEELQYSCDDEKQSMSDDEKGSWYNDQEISDPWAMTKAKTEEDPSSYNADAPGYTNAPENPGIPDIDKQEYDWPTMLE